MLETKPSFACYLIPKCLQLAPPCCQIGLRRRQSLSPQRRHLGLAPRDLRVQAHHCCSMRAFELLTVSSVTRMGCACQRSSPLDSAYILPMMGGPALLRVRG